MPSHVVLKLVHGMQKCTIMNKMQLTSFRLFSVDLLCLYGIYRTKRRCHVLFEHFTGTVEMGLLAFVLLLTLVTLNVKLTFSNATIGSMKTAAITFTI